MIAVRAFVAVRIPNESALSRPLEALSTAGGMRMNSAGGLHITLSFIGDLEDRMLPDVSEAVSDAARDIGPFDIAVKGMGSFPGKNGPRIVWIGARSGGNLERLAERTSDELDGKEIDHDRKEFIPHITVARSRDGRGAPGAVPIIEKYRDFEFFTFECRNLTVFSSNLTPSGAVHTPVLDIFL